MDGTKMTDNEREFRRELAALMRKWDVRITTRNMRTVPEIAFLQRDHTLTAIKNVYKITADDVYKEPRRRLSKANTQASRCQEPRQRIA